jgi:Zn-dependent protease
VAGLTIHEFAHAWMGNRLGDDTARRMGRVTLDPMAHIDPFGAIFFLLAWFSGFGIGWAKPVPFNPRNLENPRRDAVLIAIAGPVSNLLQVPFWLLGLWLVRLAAEHFGPGIDFDFVKGVVNRAPDAGSVYSLLASVFATGVVINIMLAAFNMIPIPPLDGHYVLEGLGPPFVTDFYNSIRPFAFILLIVLVQTPFIGAALLPFRHAASNLVIATLGLPPALFYWA